MMRVLIDCSVISRSTIPPDSSHGKGQIAMLVLARKLHERIYIGTGPRRIVITVVETNLGDCRIGIDADPDTLILREELVAEADRVEGWDRRVKRSR